MSTNDDKFIQGSGNVFADLGLSDPRESELKARLASRIYDELAARGWTQTKAAEELGLGQPDISRLTRGMLKGFSSERLMSLLVALNYSVSIRIEGNDRPTEVIEVAVPD